MDFAAAAVFVAVLKPAESFGRRFHLQNPADPVPLKTIAERLRSAGHALESVTRDEFMTSESFVLHCHYPTPHLLMAARRGTQRLNRMIYLAGLRSAADAERASTSTSRAMQELEAGFEAFETYFKSSGKLIYRLVSANQQLSSHLQPGLLYG